MIDAGMSAIMTGMGAAASEQSPTASEAKYLAVRAQRHGSLQNAVLRIRR
jgi:hypothetical protein